MSGIPYVMLQASLFSPAKPAFAARKVVAQGEARIRSDYLLSQYDLDVLAVFSEICVGHAGRGLLRQLGSGQGGRDLKRLQASLHRLTSNHIEFETGRGDLPFSGPLLLPAAGDGYQINPALGRYPGGFVNQAVRRTLRHKPLAAWLYSFYCTHRTPYDYKLATLQALTGIQRIRGFKQQLMRALRVLEGPLIGWETAINERNHVQIRKPYQADKQRTRHGQPQRTVVVETDWNSDAATAARLRQRRRNDYEHEWPEPHESAERIVDGERLA